MKDILITIWYIYCLLGFFGFIIGLIGGYEELLFISALGAAGALALGLQGIREDAEENGVD